MSEDEISKILEGIQARETFHSMRESAFSLIRSFKEIGFDREEATAYLLGFSSPPSAIPLLMLWVRRYWKKIH